MSSNQNQNHKNNNNNNNNNNRECKHKELAKNDLSSTVFVMSRYNQLTNKKNLTEAKEKELEYYVNRKHWRLID
ncbi:MAG TPA: hypothetical protein VFR65_07005 [Nitrososphaeraceae archaeon]|nr:hypothetical protein [Nitrososphaeraceae archaeon]